MFRKAVNDAFAACEPFVIALVGVGLKQLLHCAAVRREDGSVLRERA